MEVQSLEHEVAEDRSRDQWELWKKYCRSKTHSSERSRSSVTSRFWTLVILFSAYSVQKILRLYAHKSSAELCVSIVDRDSAKSSKRSRDWWEKFSFLEVKNSLQIGRKLSDSWKESESFFLSFIWGWEWIFLFLLSSELHWNSGLAPFWS